MKRWRMASYVGQVGKMGRRQEGHCFCSLNAHCMECGNEWVWKLVGGDSENTIARRQHMCETKQSIGAKLNSQCHWITTLKHTSQKAHNIHQPVSTVVQPLYIIQYTFYTYVNISFLHSYAHMHHCSDIELLLGSTEVFRQVTGCQGEGVWF